MLTNLVSWWALDEASGTRADSHGANDLTDNNTVGSTTGVAGNAATFDGTSNESLSRADNSDLSIGGHVNFAFSLWVKFNSLGSNRTIFNKWVGISDQEYQLLYNSSTNRIVFSVNPTGSSGATSVSANTFGAPSTGTWYHVYVEHDADNDTIGISINNGTLDTASHSTGVADRFATFRFGAQGALGNLLLLDGAIDEVGYWKGRVLTTDERTTLYSAIPYPFVANEALEGSTSLTLTTAANITASGRLEATTSLTLASTSSLTGDGALAGSSSLTLASTSSLTANGALAGSTSLEFTSASSLSANGALAGSTSLEYVANAIAVAKGTLGGNANLTLASDGSLNAIGALAGSTSLALLLKGVLFSPGAIRGNASLVFVANSSLTANGTLAGSTALTFDSAGNIKALGRLVGSLSTSILPAAQISGGNHFGWIYYSVNGRTHYDVQGSVHYVTHGKLHYVGIGHAHFVTTGRIHYRAEDADKQ